MSEVLRHKKRVKRVHCILVRLDNFHATKEDTQSNKCDYKGVWKEILDRTTEQEWILKNTRLKQRYES